LTKKFRPVPTQAPSAARRPSTPDPSPTPNWSFTLRYWRQIENFGVGAETSGWSVSMLERFHELSRLSVDEVMRDQALKANMRIHDTDWKAKNIPISRDDIDWVDKEYWDNEEEFPLMQFHISKALGRVVGFLDENQKFNIVLLDPKHNLQPSKFNQYKIRATTVGRCEYTGFLAHATSCVTSSPDLTDQAKSAMLGKIRSKINPEWQEVLMLPIGSKLIDEMEAAVSLSGATDSAEYLLSLIYEKFEPT